jgi:hypothetical protein
MDELGRSRCITRAAIADRAGVAIEKLYVNEMTPQERDRVLWVLGELGVRIDPKRPADYTDAELRAIAGPDCPDFGAMSDLELKRSLSRSRHPLSRALSWFLGTAVVSRCRGLRRRGS